MKSGIAYEYCKSKGVMLKDVASYYDKNAEVLGRWAKSQYKIFKGLVDNYCLNNSIVEE